MLTSLESKVTDERTERKSEKERRALLAIGSCF